MILVLPFENLGPPEEAYFASGVTEEIRIGLGGIEGVGVIARSSAEEVAGSDRSISEIGAELGVDYALDGTVRWAPGDRVRITPELIRVADEASLWSGNFDRVLDDIFAIQSEIAAQVAKQLDFSLLRSEAASKHRRTTSMAAIRAYLRGRDALTAPGS